MTAKEFEKNLVKKMEGGRKLRSRVSGVKTSGSFSSAVFPGQENSGH
jgi:hypothetical protein